MGEDISNDKTLLARFKHMRSVSITVAVVAIVIAVAGMAAGIYGVVQIQELNKKMDAAKGGAPLATPAATLECENEDDEEEKCVVAADVAEKDLLIADSDYVYIGEWGVKIHIPKGTFEKLSYNYYEFADGGEAVYLNAIVSGASVEKPEYYDFTRSLVAISRHAKGSDHGGAKVFEDDEYEYAYSHGQSVYSTDETEKDIEMESAKKLESVLTNKDNYSKF